MVRPANNTSAIQKHWYVFRTTDTRFPPIKPVPENGAWIRVTNPSLKPSVL